MANFSGTWHTVIHTPIGRMDAVFAIVEAQGAISGTASNGEETVDILGAVADGDRLTWSQETSKPMKLTVKFDVTVDGDTMTGTAKAGFFPATKLAGSRFVPAAV
jgi:hypothetical protein